MKKKTKKTKPVKEPSLFKKIIDIYFEQVKRKKALRILQKQSWSLEFLSMLFVKASKFMPSGISMTVTNKDGVSCTLTAENTKRYAEYEGDTIFNHLDDNIALDRFITENSVR